MWKSMTAYCRKCAETEGRTVSVEIKSVNNRYLDLGIKMPRALAGLEGRARALITGAGVNRGKVDVNITVTRTYGDGERTSATPPPSLDIDLAAEYVACLRTLGEKLGLADDISVMKVAALPGVINAVTDDGETDVEAEWRAIEPVLSEALEGFVEGRVREGENLRADIEVKLARMAELVGRVETLSAGNREALYEKIAARIRALLADADAELNETRLLTECAVQADRIAIDEELVRLRSHLGALSGMLGEDIPVGRKFDFQLQEVNREINTICSKCQDAAIAAVGVELKNETEKVREQIQNIE